MSITTTDLISNFINGIGIPCRQGNLDNDTFLPGIDIRIGSIIYDPLLMKYPGDLLHEAGHLAVLSPSYRTTAQSPDRISGDMDAGGAEMGAIAWSWAALKYLNLEPAVVFHEHGYKSGGPGMIENFSSGRYIGVPILQWLGMTDANYPQMTKWTRTREDA